MFLGGYPICKNQKGLSKKFLTGSMTFGSSNTSNCCSNIMRGGASHPSFCIKLNIFISLFKQHIVLVAFDVLLTIPFTNKKNIVGLGNNIIF